MAQMGAKLSVFKDPFFDRATESENIMAQIKAINDGDDDDSTNLGSIGNSGDKNSPDKRKSRADRNGGGLNLGGSPGGRKDLLNDLLFINDDIKVKADRFNDLRKRKNDLDAKR